MAPAYQGKSGQEHQRRPGLSCARHHRFSVVASRSFPKVWKSWLECSDRLSSRQPVPAIGRGDKPAVAFFESELRYPHRSNQQLDTAVLFGRTGINPAGELKRKSYLQ